MVAMLIGCGLRRAELLGLSIASIQQREEHWVIADIVGKGGHVRTVPIPTWVKNAVDAWTAAGHITDGRIFRAINKAGRIWGNGMTAKVIWEVVKSAAARAGIEKLAPHDLRARAPGYAIWPAASWSRFSSCSGMCPSKRRSGISGANRGCIVPSMTRWASSRNASSDSPDANGRPARNVRPWRLHNTHSILHGPEERVRAQKPTEAKIVSGGAGLTYFGRMCVTLGIRDHRGEFPGLCANVSTWASCRSAISRPKRAPGTVL